MTRQAQLTETSILEAALALQSTGISTIPVLADGSKAPASRWKAFQNRLPTPEEIKAWFGTESPLGLGVVTGAVSGNLEMAEVEGRAADRIPELAEVANACGLDRLWAKVCTGWLERSPSGGWHWLYRVAWPEGAKIPGNTKLAQAANGETIAETRGEGGYVIVAPSAGAVHDTGNPWAKVIGGPPTLPTLTVEEREDLHALLGTLGEPEPPEFNQPGRTPTESAGPLKPGDDFENRTPWEEILTDWNVAYINGHTTYWTRPGKTKGISATTGNATDRDRLYNFSTNSGLPVNEPLTKFAVYTHVNHGGNFKTAAAELRTQGFGGPLPAEPPPAAQAKHSAAGEPERPRSYLDGSFNAEWLMKQEFPAIRYVVEGLIPEGLTIAAGPPKIGKSWLVLGIGLDVSGGQPALGCIPTEPRPVLYLALEDGKRRLQSRLAALGATNPSPNLTFITTAPGTDIADIIAEYLNTHPGQAPVIFLDTWGKCVRPAVGGETTYERDYKVAGGLKALADAHPGSSIIVVHHTRKASGTDFIDAVSGTQGIAGAADTILLLRRARGETTGTLSGTSRDTDEGEYQVTLEDIGRWTLTGGSLAAAAAAEQAAAVTVGVGDRMVEVIEAVGRHPEGITPKNLKTLLRNLDPADVDTYLSRAHKANRIQRLKRGSYAPLPVFPAPIRPFSTL